MRVVPWVFSIVGSAMVYCTSVFAANTPASSTAVSATYGFSDRDNPWFVAVDDQLVHYCVEADPQQFKMDMYRHHELVELAISAWASQMSYASEEHSPLLVAPADSVVIRPTPIFHGFLRDATCTDAASLKIQLGFLTPEQRQAYPGLTQALSASVRTSYDRVHLQAKGFIYISPDTGPLAQASGQTPAGQGWTGHGDLNLFVAVAHELGKVMGFKAGDHGIMARGIVGHYFYEDTDDLRNAAQKFARYGTIPAFNVLPTLPHYVTDFVALPPDPTGLRQKYLGVNDAKGDPQGRVQVSLTIDDTLYSIVNVYQGPAAQSHYAGSVQQIKKVMEDGEPLVQLYLPPEQQVYKLASGAGDRPVVIDVVKNRSFHLNGGIYVPGAPGPDGLPKAGTYLPVTMHMSTAAPIPQITTIVDGQLIVDLLNPAGL